LFFLCFASVQNCETYPPARGKIKQALKNKTVFAGFMDKHDKNFIFFIYQHKKYQTKRKIPKNDYII
jgi:hypothetical protein